MINIHILTWAEYKSLILVSKALLFQYVETDERYDLYASEDQFIWQISLLKDNGSDQEDFEDNYKALGNQNLTNGIQSVFGPLTNAELRAVAVPVSAAQNGTWNVTNVSGTVSLPTGAATSALQTQPGVDIGDVTINNSTGGAAVNIQDGGNIITVDGTVTSNFERCSTSTVTLASATGGGNTVLASNSDRKMAMFYNESGVPVAIKLGSSANFTTSFTVKIPPSGYYELPTPVYTGAIVAITVGSTVDILVTELT